MVQALQASARTLLLGEWFALGEWSAVMASRQASASGAGFVDSG